VKVDYSDLESNEEHVLDYVLDIKQVIALQAAARTSWSKGLQSVCCIV